MSEITISNKKRNTIILVMLSSAFVAMLNQTLLNTALPAIISGLEITETTAQWLITGFMLVNGIMIPMTAFLMDRFHTRSLYIFSITSSPNIERIFCFSFSNCIIHCFWCDWTSIFIIAHFLTYFFIVYMNNHCPIMLRLPIRYILYAIKYIPNNLILSLFFKK